MLQPCGETSGEVTRRLVVCVLERAPTAIPSSFPDILISVYLLLHIFYKRVKLVGRQNEETALDLGRVSSLPLARSPHREHLLCSVRLQRKPPVHFTFPFNFPALLLTTYISAAKKRAAFLLLSLSPARAPKPLSLWGQASQPVQTHCSSFTSSFLLSNLFAANYTPYLFLLLLYNLNSHPTSTGLRPTPATQHKPKPLFSFTASVNNAEEGEGAFHSLLA